MSLQIKLLGPLQIQNKDGTPSEIMKWAKGCALLTYLIMTRQPQSREQMADLLWDATSTSQSLKNLRTLLWRMRKWMPDLKVTRKQVTYRGETAVSTDLQTVINALASDNPQNINEALRLYEGDLLSGFYLNDAPRFNEWLLLEREQLRQRVITAYRQLCSVYVKQSDWSQGIDVAQRWLQLDPFDEEALRELMQMLAADGETSSALKQYNHSKLHLWDEFAVEPEQATQALAEQLSQLLETGESDRLSNVVGNTQIIWPEKDELAEPGLLPSLSTIPYQRNNDFVGRRELLLHLAEQLLPWPDAEDSANRTVAITGMGGVGKTQLAVEFCYRYGRYFPGGVFWLNFADAENIVEEIVAIGGERGMGLYKDTDKLSQADQIGRIRKAWQESIPRLLVFDNCEEEVLLSEWVPVTGGCRVLLTSRRASWSRELQVRERPLSLLEKPESIALLKQLAPNLNQKEAAKIANELGHLPLAIHLAGSFLNRYPQITGKQYIKQLHKHDILDHPSLHGRGTTYSPTNHELNIFRTFGLNLEWIDTNHETNAMARHLLMCAAQFAPGEPIPRDLLLATSGHEDDMLTLLLAEDALSRLITLGFIHAKGKETITMHRLLLFFTNIVLSDNRTAQQAVEDAVWHKVRDIWERETYLGILPIAATHLHHILDTAIKSKRGIPAARFSHAWGRHLLDLSAYEECQHYLEQALTLFREQGYEKHIDMADLLMTLGTVIWQTETPREARPYYEQANIIYEQQLGANHLKTARSLNNLGVLRSRSGDFEKAIAYYERTVSIYAQIPDLNRIEDGRIHYNLGVLYRRSGDYKKAKAHHKLALSIRQELLGFDHLHAIQSMNSIAVVYNLSGAYTMALSLLEQVLAMSQEKFDCEHSLTGHAYFNIGLSLMQLARYDEALEMLTQALLIREKIFPKNHPNIACSLSRLGHLHLLTKNYSLAQSYLEQALSMQMDTQPKHCETADTLNHLGDLYLRIGELDTSRPFLDQALTIHEKVQTPRHAEIAHTLISLGDWHEAAGDDEQAKPYFVQAQKILETAVSPTHVNLKYVQKKLGDSIGNGG